METRRSALTNRSEGESRQLAELSHFSKFAHALHLLAGELLGHPGVFCARISAGRTKQAFDLLSKKVLDNIRAYLEQ